MAIKTESIVVNDEDEQQERRGRGGPVRTVNFADDDKHEMLCLTQQILPLGGNSWQEIGQLYNEYTKHNCCPE